MVLEDGDVRSELKLFTGHFERKLDEMGHLLRHRFGTMARTQERFQRRTERTTDKWAKSWWSRFGVVALGFTIAYRAMNAFEAGLRKLSRTVGDAIRESGELASLQAKLAFWYGMHSREVTDFSESYDRAAVNVNALMEASVRSISSLEELATGMDEVAQAVGAVPAKLVPALASVIDFTVMVAQTTGSTTRQIRQELQALMEGQMRTTNILIRALKNVGIITKQDIANLKAMTNRAQIFEKVLMAIHERWAEVRDKIIAADVTRAMAFWEKSIRFTLTRSIQLASKLEDVNNLFGIELAKSADKFLTAMDEETLGRIIVLIRRLRDGLVLGMKAFEGTINAIGYLAVAATNLARNLSELSGRGLLIAKVLGGLVVARVAASAFIVLAKSLWKLAMAPLHLISSFFKGLTLRLITIPALTIATAIALETLAQKASSWGDGVRKQMKEIDPGGFFGTISEGAERTEPFLQLFKENVMIHLSEIKEFLGPLADGIKEKIENLFSTQDVDLRGQLEDWKKAGRDLVWSFAKGVEDEAAIEKMTQQLSDRIIKLMYTGFMRGALLLETEAARFREIAGKNEEALRLVTIWHELALSSLKKKYEETFFDIEELSERTADAMEQNFSDLFFDAITGKLETLEDYFWAFNRSIARAFSDIMGQMMRVAIFGGGTDLAGALGGPLPSVGTKGYYPKVQGAVPAAIPHAGGTIGVSSIPTALAPTRLFENAPRLHQGTEYPAILEYGEKVTPKGVASLDTRDMNVNLFIVAADARSVSDMMHRNPQAITGPLKRALMSGDAGMIDILRRTLR